jgi:hypothetical protein
VKFPAVILLPTKFLFRFFLNMSQDSSVGVVTRLRELGDTRILCCIPGRGNRFFYSQQQQDSGRVCVCVCVCVCVDSWHFYLGVNRTEHQTHYLTLPLMTGVNRRVTLNVTCSFVFKTFFISAMFSRPYKQSRTRL